MFNDLSPEEIEGIERSRDRVIEKRRKLPPNGRYHAGKAGIQGTARRVPYWSCAFVALLLLTGRFRVRLLIRLHPPGLVKVSRQLIKPADEVNKPLKNKGLPA